MAQGKGKAISDQLAESVPAKGSNNVLRNANKAKKDEFYTQLSDIELALKVRFLRSKFGLNDLKSVLSTEL